MRIRQFMVPADGKSHKITLASFAEIYAVAPWTEGVMFWAESGHAKAYSVQREFRVFHTEQFVGTGWGWRHVGTVPIPGKALHLFERR